MWTNIYMTYKRTFTILLQTACVWEWVNSTVNQQLNGFLLVHYVCIWNKLVYKKMHTQVHDHPHIQVSSRHVRRYACPLWHPAFFLWLLLPAFVEHIPRRFFLPLKTDMSLITLKVSFHIDPSAQIAIWTSRTRLFNVIYVLYLFPLGFGPPLGRWEGEQLCEFIVCAVACWASEHKKKTACERTVSLSWPAWWLQ